MKKRTIIKIDEKKCTGCGVCIPNCPEGALQIIDGKVRLVSDLFCDGLGACIGQCPEGAIAIEERDAEPYDEKKVMENILKQGKNVIRAHLEHLKEHKQEEYLGQAKEFLKEKGVKNLSTENFLESEKTDLPDFSGCPGMRIMDVEKSGRPDKQTNGLPAPESQLGHWPVQITLVPPSAPFLQNSDVLIAADCVPFAYADFHEKLLRGKVLLVGCPKLDDQEFYREKLAQIFKDNNIHSVTCAHMEVPCCFGLAGIIKDAISASGKKIPFTEATISVKGKKLNEVSRN